MTSVSACSQSQFHSSGQSSLFRSSRHLLSNCCPLVAQLFSPIVQRPPEELASFLRGQLFTIYCQLGPGLATLIAAPALRGSEHQVFFAIRLLEQALAPQHLRSSFL